MKNCVLHAHLPDNHKKNGDLKFTKYIFICSCGEVGADSLRRDQAGLYGKRNLQSSLNNHLNHDHRDDEDYTYEVYIKEDEVLLKKGQINNLDWDDRKALVKKLR